MGDGYIHAEKHMGIELETVGGRQRPRASAQPGRSYSANRGVP